MAALTARWVDVQKALLLGRTTVGAPKAWGGSIDLSPEEEQEFRRVLYGNGLDTLFHRICYWANGERSLTDIVDRFVQTGNSRQD